MEPPPARLALKEVAARLEDILGAPAQSSRLKGSRTKSLADAEIRLGDTVFLVECKATGDVAGVAAGVRHLAAYSTHERANRVPLLVVPFMGEAGTRICSESHVSWMDLSGNARIEAPGVHIRLEGRENRFKRRGRPSNPFAPRSSRVARWLLLHPGDFFAQREIAIGTGMGEGFASRVVRRLEELELIERNERGGVRARNPRLLLEAWAEHYDFERHHLLRGHVAARSGEDLLVQLSSALSTVRIKHAATGLAGAWLLTHFAAFRTVTCYVSELPEADLLEKLGFHEDEKGANLWLALPNDEGVFQGVQTRDGLPCGHPVQVWLDLKTHPERAGEAAIRLQETLLDWRGYA